MVPLFSQLPIRPGVPPGSSWGVFGDDDEIGTLNFIGPEQVAAAAQLVRRGMVFSLNLELELPSPPFFGRKPIRHTLFEKHGGTALDDYIDDLYPQASTKSDGLRHFADPEHGFYNGARLGELTAPGSARLGMQNWARKGIAGRGVLLDVARILAEDGGAPDTLDFFPIGPDLLTRTAERPRVELRPGRHPTRAYRLARGLRAAQRRRPRPSRRAWATGCAGAARRGRAGVCLGQPDAGRRSRQSGARGDAAGRHVAALAPRRLIARLGMALGELWRLQVLAADCADDGVYEVLLASAPLNVLGGAGSPANALALK